MTYEDQVRVFSAIAFKTPELARRSLASVLQYDVPGFPEALAASLAKASNPDREIVGLDRYLAACGERATKELAQMAADPEYMRLLGIVLSQSTYLTDIVCRNPEYVRWVWEEAPLDRARSRTEIESDLLAVGSALLDDFDSFCKLLREFHKREILRIAVREMDRHAPIESVTQDLSNLAAAILDAAILCAREGLEPRFGMPLGRDKSGEPVESKFTVLAMGKLGGQELNFSSDIDLLFFFSHEGETRGSQIQGGPRFRSITNGEYFCKLGEMLIRALSQLTSEGMLFRVDMRLRPHGRDGALAVTVDSAVDYYVNYGRAWERQALIKARPCAGDHFLGQQFVERMRPFVFPKYFDDETLEDIRQTKSQLEATIHAQGISEREVKLGRGGIRDIEFTVQMLQLLNGGRNPELRTSSTLMAIDALSRFRALRPLDAAALRTHYVFLRQVEHRLQVEGGQQVHALPEDADALEEFARRLGYSGAASFMAMYRERTREIRAILEQFLATKGSGHLWIGDLLNPRSEAVASLGQLTDMGFQEAKRAREELLMLAHGPRTRPFSLHVSQRFGDIAPFLLTALAHTRRPDAVLMRLAQILQKISAPGTIYELLKQAPELCHFLVTLVSNSEYLCSLLIRDPGLLDAVSSMEELGTASTRAGLEATLHGMEGAYQADAALYRLRDGEMLRVAMRELVLHRTVAQVGDELTLLAEVILERALRHAREMTAQRYGTMGVPMAILGLGKFGGLEMGYGSDLDLLFVYKEAGRSSMGMGAAEYFSDVASRLLKRLKEPSRHGHLYDVDARLRPDGSKGMLAAGLGRLVEYFSSEAEPWERFALMKVRAVAGDPEFAAQAERAMKDVAFGMPLDLAALERIDELRRRHIEQCTALDLKKHHGGINEIEFIVRFWQLRSVRRFPELKRGDVFGAMDTIDTQDLEASQDRALVREAYARLRRVLNRIRMWDGGSATAMPASEEERADLAHRLGIDGDLVEYVDRYRRGVAALYEKTYAEAQRAAGER